MIFIGKRRDRDLGLLIISEPFGHLDPAVDILVSCGVLLHKTISHQDTQRESLPVGNGGAISLPRVLAAPCVIWSSVASPALIFQIPHLLSTTGTLACSVN